jgi:hypothetical protein
MSDMWIFDTISGLFHVPAGTGTFPNGTSIQTHTLSLSHTHTPTTKNCRGAFAAVAFLEAVSKFLLFFSWMSRFIVQLVRHPLLMCLHALALQNQVKVSAHSLTRMGADFLL